MRSFSCDILLIFFSILNIYTILLKRRIFYYKEIN